VRFACLLVGLAACNLAFRAKPDEESEKIIVPSDGRVMISETVLESGVTYTITASGTYKTAANLEGDAEYFAIGLVTAPRDRDDLDQVDVGIAIDDTDVDGTRMPRWGAYRDDHIYTVQYQGTGETITVQLHDRDTSNNTGELTLAIAPPGE
jgi:hypothetical protein